MCNACKPFRSIESLTDDRDWDAVIYDIVKRHPDVAEKIIEMYETLYGKFDNEILSKLNTQDIEIKRLNSRLKEVEKINYMSYGDNINLDEL